MPKGDNQRASRTDELLKKVLGRRFTFGGSRADLKLLGSIHQGTDANTKPGDPSFHAYVAALKVAHDFSSQVLDILDLVPFNNRLEELEEEYMPSYPPMSPVTSAFFAGWMVLDAQDARFGATLGGLFLHYLQHVGEHQDVRTAMATLNDSYCSFYEVTEVGASGLKLWDILGKRELQSWNASGYAGRVGEIWYTRLLPPFLESSSRFVTLNTPYVFRDSSREMWEQFFKRHSASKAGGDSSLRYYLKYGNSLGYWLEFIFQAFAGYTGTMILTTGIPDDPASLPHSHPKHKL